MPFITLSDDIESEWENRKGKNWWKPPDRSSEPEVLLRQVSPNTFHLMEGFRYELPERDRREGEQYGWNVPAHELDLPPDMEDRDNSTDIASVPPWLWWFIASHGRHTKAALLHDYLIDNNDVTDEQADRAFRIALAESNVPILRRCIMWTAVSLASTARARGKLFVLLGYGLPLGGLVLSLLYWGIGRYPWWPLGWIRAELRGGRWWPLDGWFWASDAGEPLWGNAWLFPLAIGLLGFVWGRRWLLGLIGIALIALPTILVWTTYLVVWVLDWCVTIVYWIYAKVRSLDVRIPWPDFGKPYRRQSRPF